MGFIETAAEAELARHALARRPEEEVHKTIESRAETMQKALDLAADDFGGDIPDDTHVQIFMNPQEYIDGAEVPVEKDRKGLDEATQKAYMGFDKLVAKLVSEGKTEEQAKRIAASIGRKKYGAQFNAPASSHH